MSAVERVSKYLTDAQQLLAAKPLKHDRIKSEVLKLSTWMRKHQDESLPDGGKGQLMECIQIYHKTALAEPQLKDAVYTLVDDCLKLPEGKLISSKAKKNALKWLSALTGEGGGASGENEEEKETEGRSMEVIDIDDDELTLMHHESGDTLEGVKVPDQSIMEELRTKFDAGDSVHVRVSPDGAFASLC